MNYDDLTKEELLKEIEEKNEILEQKKLIFENSPIGFAVSSTKGEIVETNPALLEIFGYDSEKEYRSIPAVNLYCNPDDRKKMVEHLQEKGYVKNMDIQFKRKNGDTFWGTVNAIPYKNKKGENLMLGTFYDLTVRMNSEEKLRESEERYRGLYEHSAIGIKIVDSECNIIDSNKAFNEILGYSAEELLKMTFAEITYPDDLEIDMNLFNEIIEGKLDSYNIEKRFIRKDSKVIWGNLNVTAIRSKDEKLLYIFVIVEDIDKRKQAEDIIQTTTLTRELVSQMFYEFKTIGKLSDNSLFHVGNNLAKDIKEGTLSNFLEAFKNMGLGEIILVESDEEKGKWIFTGDKLVESFSETSSPNGFYTLGFLCGSLSMVYEGISFAGVELDCQAMGDELCRFIVQMKEE